MLQASRDILLPTILCLFTVSPIPSAQYIFNTEIGKNVNKQMDRFVPLEIANGFHVVTLVGSQHRDFYVTLRSQFCHFCSLKIFR